MSRQSNFILHLIIFLSGFTFLIYEVVWNRMLSLVLGATVSASTIVLAAFMAGFSFGAYVIGKYANTSNKAIKLLSFLLIGIGISGFVNHYMLNGFLPSLYPILSNSKISSFTTETIIYSISIILILIQTFLMGGFLPVVSKIVIRSNDSLSTGLGKIYAFETLGSASGGLIAGFFFLGYLGQQYTIFIAIGINVIVGLYLVLKKSTFSQNSVDNSAEKLVEPSKRKSKVKDIENQTLNRKLALPATFVIGFSVMALQVVWMRMYKIYLTNTSYTFALISSLVIVGFFVGSWIFKRYSFKIKNHGLILFRSLILFGLFIGLGLIILVKMPQLIMFPFEGLLSSPFIKLIIMPMIAALLVVFPPAVVSGFAFPLACRMITKKINEVSHGCWNCVNHQFSRKRSWTYFFRIYIYSIDRYRAFGDFNFVYGVCVVGIFCFSTPII